MNPSLFHCEQNLQRSIDLGIQQAMGNLHLASSSILNQTSTQQNPTLPSFNPTPQNTTTHTQITGLPPFSTFINSDHYPAHHTNQPQFVYQQYPQTEHHFYPKYPNGQNPLPNHHYTPDSYYSPNSMLFPPSSIPSPFSLPFPPSPPIQATPISMPTTMVMSAPYMTAQMPQPTIVPPLTSYTTPQPTIYHQHQFAENPYYPEPLIEPNAYYSPNAYYQHIYPNISHNPTKPYYSPPKSPESMDTMAEQNDHESLSVITSDQQQDTGARNDVDEISHIVTETGRYILGENQQPVGTYALSELNEHFLSGYFSETTLLWSEGRSDWQSLSSIPELMRGISQQGTCHSISAPLNIDDEFEKWKKEVREAEAKAIAEPKGLKYISTSGDAGDILGVDEDERPPTPPEGDREFTDDGGTTYKWDLSLQSWVPQDDESVQNEQYGLEERQVLGHVVKNGIGSDVYVQNTLIHLYEKSGCFEIAHRLLGDVISWNRILSAYVEMGMMKSACRLYDEMHERNVESWNFMISGNVDVGLIEEARHVFYEMPVRNVVSWNAMMMGYAHASSFNEVLVLFKAMQNEKVKSDNCTLVNVLSACARVGALSQGRWIHAYMDKNEIRIDGFLGTALVDMHSKGGNVKKALEVFGKSSGKDISTWNSMIAGLSTHGFGEHALILAEGYKPNEVTFIGVLSARSRVGLLNESHKMFDLMVRVHEIQPTIEHYGCMVDLLGRHGWLEEAEELVRTMSLKEAHVFWESLLSACINHGNLELAKHVAGKLLELKPQDSADYVQLSNMYASIGKWKDVKEVRKRMKAQSVTGVEPCTDHVLASYFIWFHKLLAHIHESPDDSQFVKLSSCTLLAELLTSLGGYSSDEKDEFIRTREVVRIVLKLLNQNWKHHIIKLNIIGHVMWVTKN